MNATPGPRTLSKSSSRRLLGDCLAAALRAVDGRRVVSDALRSLDLPRGCPVLAFGKAAPAMLAGAADALGAGIGAALCITRADAVRPGEPGVAQARLVTGDHPVPGDKSLAAGRELLAFLDALPPGAPLLCLLSGGGSTLVEALPAGVRVAELARANRWLLASGLPIDAVNRVRAGLSCLKAGRLARYAGRDRRIIVLAISDVPGDDPAVIASGPWTPSPEITLPGGLPPWLAALVQRAPPPPRPGDSALAQVDYRVIASGQHALEAAGVAARAAGLPFAGHDIPLQGSVGAAAELILAAVSGAPPGVHGWSGETTLSLPDEAGRGGRNSHLALTLAAALEGRDDVTVMCAATDGSDGSTHAAGGWADGEVARRGRALGLDAANALARADSGAYLAATGDALLTGPTGTNVMDLVLAVRSGPAAREPLLADGARGCLS
jgi:glycerate 2-kinase